MKKNNKGFTLVELIVVLVILAILAAILVPALLGWIDKAREKGTASNAEAAYVAAQGLASEYYGVQNTASKITKANVKKYVTAEKVLYLTDIGENFKISIVSTAGSKGKNACKITKFTYDNAEYTATWSGGNWKMDKKSAPETIADMTPQTNTKDMTGIGE